jgi:glutamine synthetase
MKYGWHATFMPKPLFGENGSGMHTHMSLFSEGKNAMFDSGDAYFLSDVGKAFIAGQLKRARDLLDLRPVGELLQAPRAGAPVYVAWSRRNRSALVRVPLYTRARSRPRAWTALPGPGLQPLSAFAALLRAGLEGIEKGYELPEPMEKNLYHLAPDDRKRLGIEQLPRRWARPSSDRRVELVCARSAAYVQPLRRDQTPGVGGLPRQVTQWELDRYLPDTGQESCATVAPTPRCDRLQQGPQQGV